MIKENHKILINIKIIYQRKLLNTLIWLFIIRQRIDFITCKFIKKSILTKKFSRFNFIYFLGCLVI